MDIKIYAPVIIPTLNRFDKFRKCLESLESCTGADKTDVYVSLDYPPSEKYVEGWKKIDSYLQLKEVHNNFRALTVIRRTHNYGLKGYRRNSKVLVDDIFKTYDRFIFSEDDNVFSPNFLEYMNKGLQIYENDCRVYAICGYKNDFECKYRDNNHFANFCMVQAWGYGVWRNKYYTAEDTVTPAYYKSILFNWKKCLKLYKYNPVWFGSLVKSAKSTNRHLPLHDVNMSFYILNENMYAISPIVSKVRNLGYDGEATTTSLSRGKFLERAKIENNLIIDKESTFEFTGDPFCFVEENSYNTTIWDQRWEENYKPSLLRIIARIIKFRFECLLGKY